VVAECADSVPFNYPVDKSLSGQLL